MLGEAVWFGQMQQPRQREPLSCSTSGSPYVTHTCFLLQMSELKKLWGFSWAELTESREQALINMYHSMDSMTCKGDFPTLPSFSFQNWAWWSSRKRWIKSSWSCPTIAWGKASACSTKTTSSCSSARPLSKLPSSAGC